MEYDLEEIKGLVGVEPRIKELEKDFVTLTRECNNLKLENIKLKDSILKQESYSRKKNLKF